MFPVQSGIYILKLHLLLLVVQNWLKFEQKFCPKIQLIESRKQETVNRSFMFEVKMTNKHFQLINNPFIIYFLK